MKQNIKVLGYTLNGLGNEVRYCEDAKTVVCMNPFFIAHNVKSIEDAYTVAENQFRTFKRAQQEV